MDGKLGYWEFANMFLPIDVQQRYELEQRRVVELDDEIKHKIRRIILSIVDAENAVESIRQTLKRDLEVPLRDVFNSLDWLQRGFLTSGEFTRFFEKYP